MSGPPTPAIVVSPNGAMRAASHPGRGTASSSRNAISAPRAAARPVLRPWDAPSRGSCSARSGGPSLRRSSASTAGVSSAEALSTTSTSAPGCRRASARVVRTQRARMSARVWVVITTLIGQGVLGGPLAACTGQTGASGGGGRRGERRLRVAGPRGRRAGPERTPGFLGFVDLHLIPDEVQRIGDLASEVDRARLVAAEERHVVAVEPVADRLGVALLAARRVLVVTVVLRPREAVVDVDLRIAAELVRGQVACGAVRPLAATA